MRRIHHVFKNILIGASRGPRRAIQPGRLVSDRTGADRRLLPLKLQPAPIELGAEFIHGRSPAGK